MTVLFILLFYPRPFLFFEKQVLLLYYLYCLCKSLQRSLLLCRLSFQESGCKGKACFSFSKLFKLFFQTFFPAPRLTSFPRALSLESGCKDKAMIPPFPNFFTIIFHLFFKPPTNTLTGKTLGRKVFTGKTGKTTGKREGKAARPGKGTALSPGKHLSWTPVNVFDSSLIRI